MSSNTPNRLPHDWRSVCKLARLTESSQITDLVLSETFLPQWTTFRDSIPLSPGMELDFPLQETDWIDKRSQRIYNIMGSFAYNSYDRPADDDRRSWSVERHFNCMIYQSARYLALPRQLFAAQFQAAYKGEDNGRTSAINALKGLIMIAHNLVFNYIFLPPQPIVARIEELHPTPNPTNSSIPAVRVKHKLKDTNIEDLKRQILRPAQEGDDEKEHLLRLISEHPELTERVLGKEKTREKKTGEKRKREEDEEDNDDIVFVDVRKRSK